MQHLYANMMVLLNRDCHAMMTMQSSGFGDIGIASSICTVERVDRRVSTSFSLNGIVVFV